MLERAGGDHGDELARMASLRSRRTFGLMAFAVPHLKSTVDR
jgi:hypothetical protein